MSRVDDALRRASLDGPNVYAPVPVEPAAVLVDESALDGFRGERAPAEPARTRASAVVAPEALAPSERFTALHASLVGKGVISRETSAVSVEQYRRLAATLLSMQAARRLKTLMVSSALPNEGKTLTVTNLALTLSEAYARRVLLIDADLRRPCIHEMFGLMNVTGLGNSLRSANAPLKPVVVSSTLSVLPAGPSIASPMAALSSERMRTVVAEAAARFDWVLLDTPPVGLLSDANLVAQVTDAVLFVIAAGATPYPVVQRSIAQLGAERIVGTVLNRVENQAIGGHAYYRGYYERRS